MSLVIYNQSPTTLTPGQSFSFVSPNFTAYKVNFVGDTLGTNYDPLQFSASTQGGLSIQNTGTAGTGISKPTNITNQPAQELTVTSQIQNAFSYAGQIGSTLTYDLTPYELNVPGNGFSVGVGNTLLPTNVVVYSTAGNANIIVSTSPVTLTLTGYASNTATSTSTTSVQVSNLGGSVASSSSFSISANAINDTESGSNTLQLSLSGSYSWISGTHPLSVAITGNSITTPASNTVYAVPGAAQTQTYSITSATTPQTLSSTAGNFYNITAITLSGLTGNPASPSITATITQTFNGVAHNSAPASYATNTITASTTVSSLPGSTLPVSQSFYNITNMYFSTALPYLAANVVVGQVPTATTNVIANYQPISPVLLYPKSGYQYMWVATSPSVTYNQQNGQPSISGGLTLTAATAPNGVPATSQKYFTVNVPEYNVPGSTTSQDALSFGIQNSTTGGAQNFGFQLNQSATGTRNNMTYQSSTGVTVNAPTGFVTERGSKVAAISPSSVTINMAKVVDTLQFVVSPSATVVNSTSGEKSVGPVGIGQAVPGFSNLTVSNVTATCGGISVKTSVCTISSPNVTATPSVSQAVVPVSLNTATTPLVVLDSNANSAATLILVGSKFVNSVSAQVFAQNPSLNSSFNTGSVVVQAYGTNRILVAGYTANQTVQAGNQFINDLLQAAAVK